MDYYLNKWQVKSDGNKRLLVLNLGIKQNTIMNSIVYIAHCNIRECECGCTSCSGCLHSGQRRLWSRLLSMHFLQKVWPQGVVTGSKNNLLKTGEAVIVSGEVGEMASECTFNTNDREKNPAVAFSLLNEALMHYWSLQCTDLMQRGQSKSDTVRTARVVPLLRPLSPGRRGEGETSLLMQKLKCRCGRASTIRNSNSW